MSEFYSQFEVMVQSVATDLSDLNKGAPIPQHLTQKADAIAYAVDLVPDVLLEEVTIADPEAIPAWADEVKAAQREKPFFQRTDLNELEVIRNDIQEQNDQRRLMGEWLISVIYAEEKEPLSAKVILNSLFNYPDLAFADADYDLAEKVLEQWPPEVQEVIETEAVPEFDPNESVRPDQLFMIVGDLVKNLARLASEEQPLTKIQMYRSDWFGALPELEGASKTVVKDAFDEAWELLHAWFEDYDPSYELFAKSGRAKGTKYLLNDPDIAITILRLEEEGAQEESTEPQAESAQQVARGIVTGVDGLLVNFSEGEPLLLSSQAQADALAHLRGLSKGRFVGRNHLVQLAANKHGLPRGEADITIRSLLRSLGSSVESFYSRKAHRQLVRLTLPKVTKLSKEERRQS